MFKTLLYIIMVSKQSYRQTDKPARKTNGLIAKKSALRYNGIHELGYLWTPWSG
ncbi:MAG: hypothetical protein J7L66_06050 [Anaerolineaceae bacterium]|nr:hypothetical protein [Anaerolineaceae bacterium]